MVNICLVTTPIGLRSHQVAGQRSQRANDEQQPASTSIPAAVRQSQVLKMRVKTIASEINHFFATISP